MVFANGNFTFCTFFISAFIFFIAGKDDFGRTKNKLIIKGKFKVKENNEISRN